MLWTAQDGPSAEHLSDVVMTFLSGLDLLDSINPHMLWKFGSGNFRNSDSRGRKAQPKSRNTKIHHVHTNFFEKFARTFAFFPVTQVRNPKEIVQNRWTFLFWVDFFGWIFLLWDSDISKISEIPTRKFGISEFLTLNFWWNLDGGNSALVAGCWSRPMLRAQKHYIF